ncbi:kinase-like domain-containing protein [Mycena leptocephala]|nr:kinase-like domain-containing protein [Mycena leptocephala]
MYNVASAPGNTVFAFVRHSSLRFAPFILTERHTKLGTDLKLENILLKLPPLRRQYPAVCIADFDLALEESATKHDYPGVCGTISYLPPEAILALDDTDLTYRRKSADSWSAGVILFILISGFHPFHCIYLPSTKIKILAGLINFQGWNASTAGNNLVSLFCHPYPSLRITPEQALKHVYFHDIRVSH